MEGSIDVPNSTHYESYSNKDQSWDRSDPTSFAWGESQFASADTSTYSSLDREALDTSDFRRYGHAASSQTDNLEFRSKHGVQQSDKGNSQGMFYTVLLFYRKHE